MDGQNWISSARAGFEFFLKISSSIKKILQNFIHPRTTEISNIFSKYLLSNMIAVLAFMVHFLERKPNFFRAMSSLQISSQCSKIRKKYKRQKFMFFFNFR